MLTKLTQDGELPIMCCTTELQWTEYVHIAHNTHVTDSFQYETNEPFRFHAQTRTMKTPALLWQLAARFSLQRLWNTRYSYRLKRWEVSKTRSRLDSAYEISTRFGAWNSKRTNAKWPLHGSYICAIWRRELMYVMWTSSLTRRVTASSLCHLDSIVKSLPRR